MLNKFFLPLLAAIVAIPVAVPNVLAVEQQQKKTAPIWLMRFAPSNSDVDRAKQDIKRVIEKHINAVNQGDHPGYLQTLSPTSTEYRKAQQSPSALKMFKDFGLVARIQDIEYLKVSGQQAEVKVQVSMSLAKTGLLPEMARLKKTSSNSVNKSQTSIGILQLTKANGKWLISSMAALNNQSVPSQSVTYQPVNKQVFQKVFTQHLNALNRENLNDYLATLDRTSPNYGAAKVSTKKLFQDYDLKYELQSVEVLSQGQQDAVVKMVATVRKIRGGAFTDSQMVTFNTVKKTGSQWRIYDTQVEKLAPLRIKKATLAKK